MRFITYDSPDGSGVGVLEGGHVYRTRFSDMLSLINAGDQGAKQAGEDAAARREVLEFRTLAPLRPPKMLFSGVNYESHGVESAGVVVPVRPEFFCKLPTSIVGPYDDI